MTDPLNEKTSIWSVDADEADPDALTTYDYELDDERIAADPADRRDASKLLVHRVGGDGLIHDRFENIGAHLDAGDLLVFNDTQVVPARVRVQKETGGRVELFVLRPHLGGAPSAWRTEDGGQVYFECMSRSSNPVRPGMILGDPQREQMPAIEITDVSSGRVTARIDWSGSPLQFLEAFGEVPLPPYIVQRRKRRGSAAVQPDDVRRYQTVYASTPGAVAAPTAGLHFTTPLLAALEERGIRRTALTLTVGPGTFAPVRRDQLSEHDMHSEEYFVPDELGESIARCRRRNGRVIAVGTTSARALEAEARRGEPFVPGWRSTDLFLRPGNPFRLVDGLVTNFHLPRSTLLALVAAFVGLPTMRQIYETAVAEDYRFYSYGDATLLFRRSNHFSDDAKDSP